MQELINLINSKLTRKPLIYFCREAERALGFEHQIHNYYICCVEDNYIVDQMLKSGVNVFCAQKYGINLSSNTTSQLVSHPKVVEWIKTIASEGFYAQTFLPTNSIAFHIHKLGGTLLGNPYSLNQLFENKISSFNVLSAGSITLPPTVVGEISHLTISKIENIVGNNPVVQFEKGHTGSSTYFIKTSEDFEKFKLQKAGNTAKVSKRLSGIPYTVNGCITDAGNFVGPLQYQITGVTELTDGEGSTVGNDFSLANNETHRKLVFEEFVKALNIMQQKGYRGICGADFIVEGSNAYLIEINARQTANIPFQTQLETASDSGNPSMVLIQLAQFLSINLAEIFKTYKQMNLVEGSQVFLRSKFQNTLVKLEPKSGIYRLQSDNSAFEWSNSGPEMKEGVIYLDEDSDKPLIWQKDAYRIDKYSDAGFLILFQRKGTLKNKYDELCRIQFKEGIIDKMSMKLRPWVIEALKSIEKLIK